MKFISSLLTASLAAAFLLGCSDHKTASKAQEIDTPATVAVATDQWLGKWIGVEGLALELAGGKGKYDITIYLTDGVPRKFQGISASDGNVIMFERDGVKETIRATNGEATGLKWLLDKSNCLTIKEGKGFCRG